MNKYEECMKMAKLVVALTYQFDAILGHEKGLKVTNKFVETMYKMSTTLEVEQQALAVDEFEEYLKSICNES